MGSKIVFLSELESVLCNVLPKPPFIATISSSQIALGDEIEIVGSNFASAGNDLFNSAEAAEIISWTKTKNVCRVTDNIEDGNLLVSNSSGISNAYAFKVAVNKNNQVLNYELPDINILPGQTKYVCDLDYVFLNPSESELAYYVEIENPLLRYNTEKFNSENILELNASEEILNGSTVQSHCHKFKQ